jgi:hypothetical protein
LLGGLAWFVIAIVANAAKWQVLLRAQGVRIPFGALLEFQFVGFFFNNFLPANVGGDVMRGYGLARYTGSAEDDSSAKGLQAGSEGPGASRASQEPRRGLGDRAADAGVSVIVDRIIGLIAYMSSAALAAFVIVNLDGQRELRPVEALALAALAILVLGFALLLSRRLRALVTSLCERRILAPLAPAWRRISAAFGAYRFRYGALALAYGIGLLGIVCTALVNWSLSQAIGGLMSLGSIFLFNPLIALVLMLPVSIGGLGVNQAVYPFFFGLVGVPREHALAVSILMQLVIIVGSLPGGAFWLRVRGGAGQPVAAAQGVGNGE